MEINNILQADVLDIVFENRNKLYGAYELRRTYNKRLKTALAAMTTFCLLISIVSVLGKNSNKEKPVITVSDAINLAKVEPDRPMLLPLPPPVQQQIETIKFTTPRLAEQVGTPPPPQEDLDNTTIGTIDKPGEQITGIIAPPVEEKGTGVVEAPKVTEDYDKEFKTVQIQAKFPGGNDAWTKYLQRNLRQDTPTENGAPTGNYTVVVSFLVDKDGNISEVKSDSDPGYGTAAEAVRVIQRGPKWIPAVQNGNPVIYRQKQAVTFQVAE